MQSWKICLSCEGAFVFEKQPEGIWNQAWLGSLGITLLVTPPGFKAGDVRMDLMKKVRGWAVLVSEGRRVILSRGKGEWEILALGVRGCVWGRGRRSLRNRDRAHREGGSVHLDMWTDLGLKRSCWLLTEKRMKGLKRSLPTSCWLICWVPRETLSFWTHPDPNRKPSTGPSVCFGQNHASHPVTFMNPILQNTQKKVTLSQSCCCFRMPSMNKKERGLIHANIYLAIYVQII